MEEEPTDADFTLKVDEAPIDVAVEEETALLLKKEAKLEEKKAKKVVKKEEPEAEPKEEETKAESPKEKINGASKAKAKVNEKPKEEPELKEEAKEEFKPKKAEEKPKKLVKKKKEASPEAKEEEVMTEAKEPSPKEDVKPKEEPKTKEPSPKEEAKLKKKEEAKPKEDVKPEDEAKPKEQPKAEEPSPKDEAKPEDKAQPMDEVKLKEEPKAKEPSPIEEAKPEKKDEAKPKEELTSKEPSPKEEVKHKHEAEAKTKDEAEPEKVVKPKEDVKSKDEAKVKEPSSRDESKPKAKEPSPKEQVKPMDETKPKKKDEAKPKEELKTKEPSPKEEAKPKKKAEALTLSKIETDLKVDYGGSSAITVTTSTGSITKASWTKDGKSIRSDQFTTDAKKSTLTLSDVNELSTGKYTVTVTDGSTDVTVTFVVTVRDKPRVVFAEKTIDVKVGDAVTISASISGLPAPKITWKKGEAVIISTKNVNLSDRDGEATLTIKNCSAEHSGAYTLTADNESGSASASIQLNLKGVPSEPVGPITVSNITNTGCTLAWKPPQSDGGAKLLGYCIEKRDSKKSTWSFVIRTSQTQADVSGLVDTATYHFRVSAENKFGTGNTIETEKVVELAKKVSAPSAPLGPLDVTEITSDSVNLRWKPPMHDGGAKITGYKIEKKTTKKRNWETVIETKETKATVSGLVNTDAYHFRVFAQNEKGLSDEALSTDKEVKLAEKPKEELPPIPEGPLTVSDVTDTTCKLTWKRPKSVPKTTLISYNVEKRESKTSKWTSVIKTQETYTNVGGLINTEAYHFRVSSETDQGQSKTYLETTTEVKMVTKEVKGRFKLSLHKHSATMEISVGVSRL
ncbi:hypothetical protein L596_021934 [Steinernema carpocapsae]|uniref:Titin-like n=1 Tax=Steinernema carpocapsae TaxID=34508 RepID=A0A4U5ML26_STECR|nr:hypothetical protein L596_021934 [Steinernema carpocapsae]